MQPLPIVSVTTCMCIICGSTLDYHTDEGVTITASQFGTVHFCDKCWSFVFQSVYDSLASTGQIKSNDAYFEDTPSDPEE